MEWKPVHNLPPGVQMMVREIKFFDQPAFLFVLTRPHSEAFGLRFAYGVSSQLGVVELHWPAGLVAQVWLHSQDLLDAKKAHSDMKEVFGDDAWFDKVTAPTYPPRAGRTGP